ncbi:hypothetical protein B0J17DRAFT_721481 [Rhizoctonia solani]|nr:hypothetical protein B0J17DRAFT_721481 [Rhizoctonia solani]
MPSHAPGAESEWVNPHAYQLDSDYASLNHLVPPANVNCVLSSNADYDSVDNGHADTLTFINQSNDVSPHFNAATISASLRLQLEGSGLLDCALYQIVLPSPGPSSTRSLRCLAFSTRRRDDIVTEHILTGAPRAQQDCPPSRLSSHLFVFNSGRQSPASVPSNPGPSQRVFSEPVPTFEVAPEVPLPPSAESSYFSVVHSADSSTGVNEILRELRIFSLSAESPGLNYSHSSDFRQVTRVGPLDVHHPRAIAWGGHRSIRSGDGPSNNHSFLATSTPAHHHSGAPPFNYDDSHAQAGSTGIEQHSVSATGSSVSLHVLEYSLEEPALDTRDVLSPGISSQSSTNTAFTFNRVRAGTLPLNPPGYLYRSAQFGWINGVSIIKTFLPSGEDPSYSHQVYSDQIVHSPTPGSFDSTFSSTGNSANDAEIVGNRPEWSPFGPAIHPETFEGTALASIMNEPARPVHIRPLANVPAPQGGAQTNNPPPTPPAEYDESFGEFIPPTPCPPPRDLHTQHPSVENAYNHGIESPPSAVAIPENTLPSLGYPQNPTEVTLPSIGQTFAEVDESEVLDEVDESEELGAPDENGIWVDMRAMEGDDEDEYYECFSCEDGFEDLEYAQFVESSGSQQSVLVYSWSGSSPFTLDYYSTEGTAYSDDGYVGYSTDLDAE